MVFAITAVNGQLGTKILKALSEKMPKSQIIGLARTPEKAESLGIEIRPGDYSDAAQMQTSLTGVETLLFVSGNNPPDERARVHRNVVNAARDAGVKKIIYTSVQGVDHGPNASPVVVSNRQTEQDIKQSGLDYVIGRNGIYIEPDVEYIETYKKDGEIKNSAGDGKCGYTTRSELSLAYANMLTEPRHLGQTYNLHGRALTQAELAQYLNQAFGTSLTYHAMSVEEYVQDRIAELGAEMGPIIASIYEAIRNGAFNLPSDFETAAGRPHQTWDHYFQGL